MFCTSCGRSIDDNSKFCIYCGKEQEPFPDPAPNRIPASNSTYEWRNAEAEEGRIVLQDKNDPTKIYVCESKDSGVMGREASSCCMVIEDDKSVSRRHCRFTCQTDGWYVEDLGSYNHTFLNGREVSGLNKLRDGDVLKLGAVDLMVVECGTKIRKPESLQGWFCTRCGNKNLEKHSFCTNCGMKRQ